MSLPSVNDAHYDALLSNLLIGYRNADYIYPMAAPVINTGGVESGAYGIFTQKHQFLNQAEVIAAGGPYPHGGFGVSTTTYSTREVGMGTDLPDRTLANASGAFKKSLRMAKARWVADQCELYWEIRIADAFFASSWGTNDTTAIDWSDYTNSNPILDINTAIYTIEAATGVSPNRMIIGNVVWRHLKQNPVMLDFLGSNERGLVTKADAEDAFGLELLIGKAIKNTANEGQDASYSDVWGANALILHVNPATPDPFTASAAYIFESRPFQVKTYRLPDRDTEFFRGSVIRDYKITATNLGYYFSAITS